MILYMAKMKVLRRVFAIAIAIVALISLSVAFAIPARAMHKLSYIKEKSGYYILYDTSWREYRSISTGNTHIIGWSSTHFVVSDNQGYYIIYDANGKKVSELSMNKLGTVTDVIENAIISKKDNYIYKWDVYGSRYIIISGS